MREDEVTQRSRPKTYELLTQRSLIDAAYSWCLYCDRSWRVVDGHHTFLNEHSGVFPLCEGCWKTLSVEHRIPFYRKLYEMYDEPKEPWEVWEKAVREGK